MPAGLMGRKVGMTSVFDETGAVGPVTVIQAGPCWVTQVKTSDAHGYNAVQLGFEESRKLNSPERGHLAKAGSPMLRHLREWHVPDPAEYELGQRLDVSMFEPGERVTLVGTSKGKGFQGVVKRHHFRGGRATHGSMFHRAPGSIGASAFPSRVMKGMRMGGRMGGDQVTVKNLRVAKVEREYAKPGP